MYFQDINFQMKDAAEGGALRVQYGEFYQDEQSYKVEGNIGLPLGANGFINASLEYSDNDGLSHGHQRGTIDGPSPSAKLGSVVFVDLELGYNFNDNLRFLVGGSNVFDEFVDKIRPTDTCGSSGLTPNILCLCRWSEPVADAVS